MCEVRKLWEHGDANCCHVFYTRRDPLSLWQAISDEDMGMQYVCAVLLMPCLPGIQFVHWSHFEFHNFPLIVGSPCHGPVFKGFLVSVCEIIVPRCAQTLLFACLSSCTTLVYEVLIKNTLHNADQAVVFFRFRCTLTECLCQSKSHSPHLPLCPCMLRYGDSGSVCHKHLHSCGLYHVQYLIRYGIPVIIVLLHAILYLIGISQVIVLDKLDAI